MKYLTLLSTSLLVLLSTPSYAVFSMKKDHGRQSEQARPDVSSLQVGDKLNNPKLYVEATAYSSQPMGLIARVVIPEKNKIAVYFVDFKKNIVEPPVERINIEYRRTSNRDIDPSEYMVAQVTRSNSGPSLVGRGNVSSVSEISNVRLIKK